MKDDFWFWVSMILGVAILLESIAGKIAIYIIELYAIKEGLK